LPYLTGQVKEIRAKACLFDDDGTWWRCVPANWKICIPGTALPWNAAGLGGTFHVLRLPKL